MINIELKNRENPLPGKVKEYLKKFGETPKSVYLANDKKYEMVIVIPVLAEYENIIRLLNSLIKTEEKHREKFLLIFVVNNVASANAKVKEDNAKTFDFLVNFKADNLFWGIIDAFSSGNELNEKTGGVGLARKIGLDTALYFLDYSSKNSLMLISLDADCEISENYFSDLYRLINERKIEAGYVNFEHPVNIKRNASAIVKYEIFLRYYVLGLKYAESHYAYFSIGSTMFSDWKAYVKSGGMNKRRAGEDFYFMEKLAKNYKIKPVKEVYVYPSPRESWRVPFGTGRSISDYLSGVKNLDVLFNPAIFEVLKSWNRFYINADSRDAEFYLEAAQEISEGLYKFLVTNNFGSRLGKILKEGKRGEQILKQKIFLFDAFTTLKLIHFLRDGCFPSLPLKIAVREMLEKFNFGGEIPDTEAGILNLLRKEFVEEGKV